MPQPASNPVKRIAEDPYVMLALARINLAQRFQVTTLKLLQRRDCERVPKHMGMCANAYAAGEAALVGTMKHSLPGAPRHRFSTLGEPPGRRHQPLIACNEQLVPFLRSQMFHFDRSSAASDGYRSIRVF